MSDALLSRIAETLYWTGRYVERADDTARTLDVYVHYMLEDPDADEDADCRGMLAILGVPAPDEGPMDIGTALSLLAYDPKNPSAISGAIRAARAGVRSVRDVVSSEMWECLNVTSLGLSAQRRSADRLGPHMYFRFVRERAALFFGLAESTMSHDDAWRFLVLGRSLERVDMTARLLLARMSGTRHQLGWLTVLHACGAHESFIRTHGWASDPSDVAEFLMLDRLFPRSVLAALTSAEEALRALDPGDADRSGTGDPARREIGQLRTRLEYADPGQIETDLPDLIESLQGPAGRPTRPSPSATSPTRPRWPGRRRADMGWRVGVVHTTKVTYRGTARASYNECRMTPPTMTRQTTLATSVRTGSNVPIWSYRDYFGTTVSSFDIQEPHEELLVQASATVQTSAAPPAPTPLPWIELRERAAASYVLEYLAETGAPPWTTT